MTDYLLDGIIIKNNTTLTMIITGANTKDIKMIIKELKKHGYVSGPIYEDPLEAEKGAKIIIKDLKKEGWIKENKERYECTEMAKKQIEIYKNFRDSGIRI